MAQPQINSVTGEPQSASGWSQDDPANAAPAGADALGPQSPMAARFMKGMDKLDTIQEDERQQFEKGEAAAQPLRNREMQQLLTPVQARAHLEKLKEAPKPEDYQKGSMEFASSMALVGAVFGRFSRRGGTAALNAFSGALKGWHEGNMEAYGNAQKEWEANTKATLANNQMEIEKYREIIENKKLNIDQMSAALTIAAQPFQNKLMFDYAQEKNINGALNLYDKMTSIQERATGATDTLIGFNSQSKEQVKSAVDTYNQHPELFFGQPPQKQAAIRMAAERWGLKINDQAPGASTMPPAGMTPQQFDINADLYRKTGQLPQLGWGTEMNQAKLAVINHATEREANQVPIDPAAERLAAERASYQGDISGARSVGVYGANIEAQSNLAKNAIPAALAASQALPRGTFVPVNQAIQLAQQKTSDPAVRDFAVKNLQLAELWAKAMNPRGIMRESDRQLALDQLSIAQSPESYRTAVKALWQNVEREKESIAATRREMGGGQGGLTNPFADEAPPPGTVEDGFRFKGGDPGDQNNWEQAN